MVPCQAELCPMLSHVQGCRTLPGDAEPCYCPGMPCHAEPRFGMLCHAIPKDAVPCYCQEMLSHGDPCPGMPRCVMLLPKDAVPC